MRAQKYCTPASARKKYAKAYQTKKQQNETRYLIRKIVAHAYAKNTRKQNHRKSNVEGGRTPHHKDGGDNAPPLPKKYYQGTSDSNQLRMPFHMPSHQEVNQPWIPLQTPSHQETMPFQASFHQPERVSPSILKKSTTFMYGKWKSMR